MGQSVNQSVRLGRLLLGNPSPYIKTSSPISKYSCLYCPGSLVKGEMIPSIIDSRDMGWPSANNPSVGIRCRDQDMRPWESHLTDWPLNEREAWARIGRLVLPCRHRFLTVSVTRQAPQRNPKEQTQKEKVLWNQEALIYKLRSMQSQEECLCPGERSRIQGPQSIQ